MRIRLKVVLSYLVVILLMCGLSGAMIYSLMEIETSVEESNSDNETARFVKEKVIDHMKWASSLSLAVINEEPFEGELDPEKCSFGQWIIEVEGQEIDDELRGLFEDIHDDHEALHATAEVINELIVNEQYDQAKQLYENEALVRLGIVEGKLNDIEAYYVSSVEESSSSVNSTISTSNILALVLTVIAVVAAIVIAMIFSNSVVNPIGEIVNNAKAIAGGDLTVQMNPKHSRRKDELGELSIAFKDMIANLTDMITTAKEMTKGTLEVSGKIAMVMEQINQSASETASATNDVAEGASHQTHVATGVFEMIKYNEERIESGVENINITEESAKTSTELAATGVKAINEAVDQFSGITKTITFAKESIDKLNKRTSEIGEIVDLISGISTQTNLLALNASIEAARAGEQGKGFAVVAEEVRKLAEASATATTEISDLIQDIQTETTINVNTMEGNVKDVSTQIDIINEGKNALEEIEKAVKNSEVSVNVVADSFRVVSEKTKEISDGFSTMMDITESTSASSEEVAAAMEEQLASITEVTSLMNKLNEDAMELNKEMEQFKVEVSVS